MAVYGKVALLLVYHKGKEKEMKIKWFWCRKCDGTHYDPMLRCTIPHNMPFKGELVKTKKCSCGNLGFIFQSLQEA